MSDTSVSALIQALPMPVVAIDNDERIIALNDPATAMLGQGALSRHYITVLRQPTLVEAVEQCLAQDNAQRVTYLAGNDVTYDVHLQRTGNVVLVCFQDVTQQTQAGLMRRDFVANVSHELRTPLTALMGFIETLRGPARDDSVAQQRFLGIMSDEAERMNRLIGDLLSLSRVEAEGRIRPKERVNLLGILSTTLRNISPLADEAKVEIALDAGTDPLQLLGDADQLQQVFSNLIENGVKYASAGGRIDVSARLIAHDAALRGPAIRVGVRDYGPGIAPEHLPRLTERFYRADSHRSRALGGTGLGLAITKHILNRHRGRLKITSDLGQGAEFTVILPPDLVGSPE